MAEALQAKEKSIYGSHPVFDFVLQQKQKKKPRKNLLVKKPAIVTSPRGIIDNVATRRTLGA